MAKGLTPATAGNIQRASAEEISALTETILGVDKDLNQAADELNMLNEALDQLEDTKDIYDYRAMEARGKMQKLMPKL